MSLHDILHEILKHAEKEADRLKKDAEAEKSAIRSQRENAREKLVAEVEKKTAEAQSEMEASVDKLVEREHRKTMSVEKRRAVETFLTGLLESLSKLSEKEYQAFLKGALEQLGEKEGSILVPASHKAWAEKVCPAGLKVVTDAQVKSGFCYKGPRFSVDMTFEYLVNSEFRGELEVFVLKSLS